MREPMADQAADMPAEQTPSTSGCGASEAVQLGQQAREFLRALASEQRQQMLELFTGGIELTVGTVAERLGIAQPTASQQLAILRRGGLLTSRKHGKQVFYRIDTATVERSLGDLQTYLHTCCPPPEQHRPNSPPPDPAAHLLQAKEKRGEHGAHMVGREPGARGRGQPPE